MFSKRVLFAVFVLALLLTACDNGDTLLNGENIYCNKYAYFYPAEPAGELYKYRFSCLDPEFDITFSSPSKDANEELEAAIWNAIVNGYTYDVGVVLKEGIDFKKGFLLTK